MTQAPTRWLEPRPLGTDNGPGALLAEADVEYSSGLDEAVAFERLCVSSARRDRRRRQLRTAGVMSASLAVLAAAWIWLRPGTEGVELAFGPERTARVEVRPAPSLSALEGADRSADPPPVEPPAVASPRSRKPPEEPSQAKPISAPPTRALPSRDSASPDAVAPGVSSETQPDCMALARNSQTRQAEQCFTARAQGTGLAAEMALYEVARLRRDVLRDPESALGALDEFRRRFPSGSLRREVDMSRVEILVGLGRANDALRESAELLGSSAGRERAGELHLLRGNVYRQTLADPQAALAEYASAERSGGALGAEATYLRATCLESLGDEAGAVAAYRAYLSSSAKRTRSVDAQRRIDALSQHDR